MQVSVVQIRPWAPLVLVFEQLLSDRSRIGFPGGPAGFTAIVTMVGSPQASAEYLLQHPIACGFVVHALRHDKFSLVAMCVHARSEMRSMSAFVIMAPLPKNPSPASIRVRISPGI